MRSLKLILVPLLAGPSLILSPMALADSGGNASAHASGELVGGSVEAGATLASAGIAVTSATVVAVAGTSAAIVTGDAQLADDTLNFAADIASAPFAGHKPLEIDADIVVPAGAPDVPFERPAAGQN
ncbi:hypothetical protein [Maricaulis parjimensis]|uniref:hypothetical protein n=1 Tax=Maricaulis parjimensis TaxID=144023 RepID=UPI00193A4071|nr:hypothetical protein [Maricaulis parjimensis]